MRTELLLGREGIERLKRARVAIFGVGGVGSFAAEAVARVAPPTSRSLYRPRSTPRAAASRSPMESTLICHRHSSTSSIPSPMGRKAIKWR